MTRSNATRPDREYQETDEGRERPEGRSRRAGAGRRAARGRGDRSHRADRDQRGAFVRIFRVVPPNLLLMSQRSARRPPPASGGSSRSSRRRRRCRSTSTRDRVNLPELLATCQRGAGQRRAGAGQRAARATRWRWRSGGCTPRRGVAEAARRRAGRGAGVRGVVVPYLPRQAAARAALAVKRNRCARRRSSARCRCIAGWCASTSRTSTRCAPSSRPTG